MLYMLQQLYKGKNRHVLVSSFLESWVGSKRRRKRVVPISRPSFFLLRRIAMKRKLVHVKTPRSRMQQKLLRHSVCWKLFTMKVIFILYLCSIMSVSLACFSIPLAIELSKPKNQVRLFPEELQKLIGVWPTTGIMLYHHLKERTKYRNRVDLLKIHFDVSLI